MFGEEAGEVVSGLGASVAPALLMPPIRIRCCSEVRDSAGAGDKPVLPTVLLLARAWLPGQESAYFAATK
jgi:hypothetical protein